MKIDLERKNELLHRKEVRIFNSYDSNPGKSQASKNIAEHFKAEEGLVVINKIESSFGTNNFIIDAFIYDDTQSKDKVERKKITRRERKKK